MLRLRLLHCRSSSCLDWIDVRLSLLLRLLEVRPTTIGILEVTNIRFGYGVIGFVAIAVAVAITVAVAIIIAITIAIAVAITFVAIVISVWNGCTACKAQG